jgi:hypothetical protein
VAEAWSKQEHKMKEASEQDMKIMGIKTELHMFITETGQE